MTRGSRSIRSCHGFLLQLTYASASVVSVGGPCKVHDGTPVDESCFLFFPFFLSRSWGVFSIILVFSKGASRDGSLRICWALGRVVSERWERVRDLRDSKQPSSCHASLLDCFVYVSGVRLRYSFIAYISSRGIQMCCLGNVSRPASCEALVCALGGGGCAEVGDARYAGPMIAKNDPSESVYGITADRCSFFQGHITLRCLPRRSVNVLHLYRCNFSLLRGAPHSRWAQRHMWGS